MARIVVIDDEDQVRRMVRRILEADGHEVLEASNGKEAMPLLRARPELVITDAIMPEQDGMEVLMMLRREGLPLKVIVMSGGGVVGKTNVLQAADMLGAAATLSKPFTMSEMLDTVRATLAA